ncbi:MAG: hypothetical protein PHN75_04700 [Syntrophales bacterium]|nr:hypothetical protein [Syntrophales bacterium]
MELILYHKKQGQDVVFARGTQHVDISLVLAMATRPDMEKIHDLFSRLATKDGKERHQEWLAAIKSGAFSFGSEDLDYAEDGENSWKAQSLGTDENRSIRYEATFLTSNWKLFHDALQQQRLTILHDILPKYGICAA